MFSVRMTKGNVDAGNFLVLQNVSNNVGAGGIGADSKFAHTIAVFGGAGVEPKIVAEIFVFGTERTNTIVLHLNDEGRALEITIALTQIIAYHAIIDENTLGIGRRGQDVATRQ